MTSAYASWALHFEASMSIFWGGLARSDHIWLKFGAWLASCIYML